MTITSKFERRESQLHRRRIHELVRERDVRKLLATSADDVAPEARHLEDVRLVDRDAAAASGPAPA